MSHASSPSASSSWAGDLLHPLPLAAVAVLAINDHLLKGAGVLPGWLTGKLSDVAGLFFFPILLAVIARGAWRLAGFGALDDRKALAAAAGLATGAVFTAVKLYPPFNVWVAGVWGVMRMDATDLFALPMIPLSAAFMVRASGSETAPGTAFRSGSGAGTAPGTASASPGSPRERPARRFVELAAVLAAGLASAATSKAPDPPPAAPMPPPPPAEQAVAMQPSNIPCATLELTVCERSRSGTFVVARATGVGPGSCEVDVAEAAEIVAGDGLVNADMLPARVRVKESESTTFSLSFLRPIDPPQITGNVTLRLQVRGARADGDATSQSVDVSRACVER